MDLNSMLPFLMMNKDGNNKDMMGMINAINAMRNNKGENKVETASADSSDYIHSNCKEPRFWNSPARECGSETKEEPKGKPDTGFNPMDMLGMMGDNNNLAPLLAMMNNKGGGANPLMSMLPFLMNNSNKAKTVSVNHVSPFEPVRHFCPLSIRMKLNYFLAK